MRELSDYDQRALGIRAKLNEADPIWGEVSHVYETFNGLWIVLGDRCGTYSCAPNLRATLTQWPNTARACLTTWINDQNRSGEPYPFVGMDAVASAHQSRGLRFAAKLDRFFTYLDNRRYRIGDLIIPVSVTLTPEIVARRHVIMRWIEASSEGELRGFIAALESGGLATFDNGKLILTAEGLMRLDTLGASGENSDQAFVAMWFSSEMDSIFSDGITPGLEQAGFKPFRIDRKEHANKIDDEIIAEIRKSRFVVADFTCGVVTGSTGPVGIPRGGVYYEAGFAQGLGMPVIWTVRKDQIDLVHFDTRQFNHIVWEDAEDLRVQLYRRVAAVIGHYRPI